MSTPQHEVLATHRRFWRTTLVCAGILVVIHVWPKSNQPHNQVRLLLTIVYFATLLYGLWHLVVPRARYLERLYAWRFEDAPMSFGRIWRRYLHALDQVTRVLGFLAIGFIASTGLATLALWFPGIGSLRPLYTLAWWISLIGLVAVPIFGGFLFTELTQNYRLLRSEMATSQVRPRPMAELRKGAPTGRNSDRVVIEGSHRFRAGGREWHWESLYKNCIVFGQTGTGKTLCVLNAIVDGLLGSTASDEPAAGLILDPKGDFAGKIERLCGRYGRDRDLLVIDPSDPKRSIRWNPLDSDDDAIELASQFTAVLESLGMKEQQSSFWIDAARKFIGHAITLLRKTNPRDEPPSFREIGRLASSIERIADRTDRLDPFDPDVDACLSFFADEWSGMAIETRSSIQAYITNMIDPFLMEPYQTLFSGPSTIRMDDVLRKGRIVYVHMPIADKEAMSRTIGTFVKLAFFRAVLKAPDKVRPSFFLCDEFQTFFTTAKGKGDADFFERSRQSAHASIIATQNLPALLKVTPQEKHPAMNLLGNCATKIFLRNTDPETNEWASRLFGQRLVAVGSVAAAGPNAGRGRGGGQSVSASDQFDAVVRPERFTELAIPSRTTGADHCEAIIHLAAEAVMESAPRKHRWAVHPI